MFLLGNNVVLHSNSLALPKKCPWYQEKKTGHKKEAFHKNKRDADNTASSPTKIVLKGGRKRLIIILEFI